MSSQGESDLRLGFLTAIETAQGGYAGGLLVTSRMGRPLEFQCTSPVRPNHTQKLLYGPTLLPWIFGDLIGRTLVERASVQPQVLFVDQPEFLELRQHLKIPVACLDSGDAVAVIEAAGLSADSAGSSGSHGAEEPVLSIGNTHLRLDPAHQEDRETIRRQSDMLPAAADLAEPFDRVREALRETLPV